MSGHQVNLNGSTCQSQSRWPSVLKVVLYNKPIGKYLKCVYLGYFYIDDLRSGQFLALFIIPNSMREKSGGSFFVNTSCNSKFYHEWHQSWHTWLGRCKFSYIAVVRSYDVIKGHRKFGLLIAPHRKDIQTRAWSHCVQIIKGRRMICTLTLRSRDLIAYVDLEVTWPDIFFLLMFSEPFGWKDSRGQSLR